MDLARTKFIHLVSLRYGALQLVLKSVLRNLYKDFVDKACDSKSHPTKLWRVISAKLDIGKKITRLRIMRLNREKSSMFSNL